MTAAIVAQPRVTNRAKLAASGNQVGGCKLMTGKVLLLTDVIGSDQDNKL